VAAAPSSLARQKNDTKTIPAEVHFFIVADEMIPGRKVTRRVFTTESRFIQSLISSEPQTAAKLLHPEQYGLWPRNVSSTISLGQHVMENPDSPFISASNLPKGAPYQGRLVYIDVSKLKRAGVTLYETQDLLQDLDRLKAASADSAFQKKVEYFKQLTSVRDREVLLDVRTSAAGEVPAAAIKSAASMGLTRSLQFVQGVGIVVTVYDLGQAGVTSFSTHSLRPFEKEAGHDAVGWGGAIAGARLFAMGGAALGIETGPGAIVTGAVGGVVGGIIGFFAADWVEKQVLRW
jgi:outer membrane lipoprotein SlyB